MSLTQKERKIIEQNGFTVHKYNDGYVELENKTGFVFMYDSLETTAYEGLKEYKNDLGENLLLHLKMLKS